MHVRWWCVLSSKEKYRREQQYESESGSRRRVFSVWDFQCGVVANRMMSRFEIAVAVGIGIDEVAPVRVAVVG